MNKVALITGASKGIGNPIAIKLAEIAYYLLIVGRNKSQLVSTKNEVEKSKVKCSITEAGLAEPDAPVFLINEVIHLFVNHFFR